MVLIPNDIGIRMRMQTEANLLQPVTPLTEIASDLPAIQTGQRFSARIQEVLPENTFKALVAGKSLTLSLPEGAKAGDTLELVLIDRTPKVLIAQLAPQAEAAEAGQPYQFTSLSRAGQLIGSLLPPEGESPAPAALNRGEPLLAQPPQKGSQLAPALAVAVKQSGLFYESHQVQWLTGRMPLQQLLLEPQGKYSAPQTLTSHGLEAPLPTGAEKSALAERRSDVSAVLQTMFGRETAAASTAASRIANPSGAVSTNGTAPSSSPATNSTPAQQVPEELRPLVQQQLDSVATQRLAWHGEVWPNQPMDWEIEWQDGRNKDDSDEESTWTTSLRLTTPRLGEINARVQLGAGSVRVAIVTPSAASADDLRNAAPALEETLAAAGVPLRGLSVKHYEEPAVDG
jgi:hypothetical protein